MTPNLSVGQHVVNPTRGVDRPIHGIRRTADGIFLQFAPDGEWHAADGFVTRQNSDPLSAYIGRAQAAVEGYRRIQEAIMPSPSKLHALPGLLREFTAKLDAAAEKIAAEMGATGDHAVAGMEKVSGVVRGVKQTADDMHNLADDAGANGGPPLDDTSGSTR
jgi:hypothetical protein